MKSKANAIRMQKDKSHDQKLEETRQLLQEKHMDKAMVGLFDRYDKLVLERFVGTGQFKKMIRMEAKDVFEF
jgi:hypothetical protein